MVQFGRFRLSTIYENANFLVVPLVQTALLLVSGLGFAFGPFLAKGRLRIVPACD